ncbi:hypothetical protein SeMB42_g04001 [Synchytrium endobioticum]|uniref:LITAF domain-containing protein n=1 Tax=Synchytrium endobioticum TaxID=286115 RepID=A0A507D2B8_9FUNG|nr:hypothetical protein SeMB42_g04001 [Synchytrium endobioticum]
MSTPPLYPAAPSAPPPYQPQGATDYGAMNPSPFGNTKVQKPSGAEATAQHYAQHPSAIYIPNSSNANVPYQIQDGVLMILHQGPVLMYCPTCHKDVVTKTSHRPGLMAGLSSACLCVFCWPLFFLPCCFQRCLDQVHKCSQCHNTLAIVVA